MIKQKGYLSLPPLLLISLPCLCNAFWLQSSHIIYRRPLFKRHLPPASRHHSASLKLSLPCLILTGSYHKSVFSLWFICSFIVLPAVSYAGAKITWWVWVQRTSSELKQVPHLCLFDSAHQFLQYDFGWHKLYLLYFVYSTPNFVNNCMYQVKSETECNGGSALSYQPLLAIRRHV